MRSTDHQEMPWILLPLSARPPVRRESVSEDDLRPVMESLAACGRASNDLLRQARRRQDPPGEITAETLRHGWRKFFLSHFAFFYNFSLLAECYGWAAAHLRAERRIPEVLSERACALWRLAGALMAYGVDFVPTEEIYCTHIRPFMADGLSGTWLREYQNLSRRRKAWRNAVATSADPDGTVAALNARLNEAERCYRRCHVQVMQACVPDMISKLQDYEATHGPVEISAEQLQAYDRWFHVTRSEEVELAEYLRTACSVLDELLADVSASTGLSEEILTSLSLGIKTMSSILTEYLAEPAEEWPEATV